jgi:SAM-dependent methyltransferase
MSLELGPGRIAAMAAAGMLIVAGLAAAGGHDHDPKHDPGDKHPGDEHPGECAAEAGKDHPDGHADGKHAGDHHPEAASRHHGDHATVHHSFEDAAEWARRFESPDRDEWQLPDRVVEALVDRPDLVVADIGSATGYFPVRFARAAPAGMVFGADIEPDMVRYLNDRAAKEGIGNLVSVLAGPNGPHLPRPADLVFLCNTYHHIDGRIAYFGKLKEKLRPGGRVAIVDYRPESERGPSHKLAAEVVEKEMGNAGYRLAARHDFLPEQYFLVFEPAG